MKNGSTFHECIRKEGSYQINRWMIRFIVLFITLFIPSQIKLCADNLRVETVQQTSQKVRGIVKDSKGETIIGANVLVEGTTIGTITDLNGSFTIQAPENATKLKISFIGFNET